MRRAVVLLSALAALGCAGERWVREGASEAQFAQDRQACEAFARAGARAPRTGLGVGRPDLSVSGDVPSGVDVTLGLRGTTSRTDLFERCMAERGWRRQ